MASTGSNKKSNPQLIFPTDLSRVGFIGGAPNETPNIPYIKFEAYQWAINANEKRNASIFIQKTPRGSVFLPLSETMTDNQTINWETEEGIGAKNIFELATKSGLNFIRNLTGTYSKFIETRAGKTINDLQSLSFGLTNFREWGLTFKLLPKGQRDSQRLAEVIQFFKQNSIADFLGSVIDYPSFFTIKVHFPTGESGKLFNQLLIFKTSVITNIGIQYIPEGNPAFYRDGAPTQVVMDISLRELERVSRREYNLGIG